MQFLDTQFLKEQKLTIAIYFFSQNYMYWRYMNTFNRIMPFMERTLAMRNGGSKFFMGDMVSFYNNNV